MTRKYGCVAVGGTFDRLHEGHEKLLQLAFEVGDLVVVGVTSDGFVESKDLANLILPYSVRLERLRNWAAKKGWVNDYELVEINDVYGVTLSDKRIEALVVSQETLDGAEKVNRERLNRGMKKLPIEVVGVVYDKIGRKISSTLVRSGRIGRDGEVYGRVFKQDWVLTDKKRKVLENPMGVIVKSPKKGSLVGVVGDISLESFVKNDWAFDYGVFDGKNRRIKSKSNVKVDFDYQVTNPKGMIRSETVDVVKKMLREPKGMLKIRGEEDLLVLPLILLMPLESFVYYGQPGVGLVEVWVNEQSKKKWYEFVKRKF